MDSSKGWELLRWNIDNADYDYNNYGDGDDEAEMKRGGVVLPNCGWNDRSPVRTASFLLTLSLSLSLWCLRVNRSSDQLPGELDIKKW